MLKSQVPPRGVSPETWRVHLWMRREEQCWKEVPTSRLIDNR